MSKLYDEEPIAEINIIPFVDIILVILIIFMVTVPQMAKEGFSIRLPKASSAKKISPSKLNITVSNTGDIFIDSQLTSPRQLALIARKAFEEEPSLKAVISADKSVSHGRVMEIIDIIKESGISQFVFSAQR